ncbi:hypothetical protein [Anaplasma marginale]|uniref:hypothetical protein n=1 Tax=Anaplasma marginale TaxID=770 RepID=UPI001FB24988|nr:hypothetical protein [Anaplasma marginale]
MSMGDVHRLKKEVVGSIGRGTASPVRAMFSREISAGDTLLAGEMVGVDEGLVIQELSRPEELEKLQHELAKQVSKLAELGELKWLEQLETLETEELQRVKDRIGEIEAKKIEEVKAAKGEVAELKTWEQVKLKGGEKWKLEELRGDKLKELEKKLGTWIKVREKLGGKWKRQGEMLKNLKSKLEELAAIRGLKEEIEKINEPGELKALEAKKLEEVEAARKGVVEKIEKVKEKVGDTGLGKKVEELGEKFKRLTEQDSAELEKFWAKKLLGEQERKNLKKKLEELAAIRELKELGLEEQLRILAEIKEVKRLAERQKAGEFGIQEGLQLTEKITALSVGIVGGKGRLEAKKLGEADGRLVEKLERLGRLDELVPGKRAQALEEMKATLKQLKEIKLREVKAEIEAQKSAKFKEKNLVAQSVGIFGTIFGLVERTVTGRETLGNVLKIQDVAKLENLQAKLKEATEKKGGLNALEELEKIKGLKVEKLAEGLKALAKIKALEELTEIAEKRGVATVMKAALTNAMEITKNRGWTDYLNSLDVSERANAARELIAAEKIRKWARDINNLDADERAMVAGALTLFLTPSTTV